jgi:hypothetical protein
MLKTVRQQPWQKTQLWGLYKTQDGSGSVVASPVRTMLTRRIWINPNRSQVVRAPVMSVSVLETKIDAGG